MDAETKEALFSHDTRLKVYETLIAGILEMLVEKGLVTNKDIRLMVEQRAARVLDHTDESNTPQADAADLEQAVCSFLAVVAEEFDIPDTIKKLDV